MAIIFKYVNVLREDGTLKHAPYIPIFLRDNKSKVIRVAALLDSGADDTVVPKDLAEVLGLKEQGRAFDTSGIGGATKVREATLPLTIKGAHEKYSMKVKVLVLQNKDIDVPLLLGRNGFFEQFHVTFKQDQKKIVLKKIQPKHGY